MHTIAIIGTGLMSKALGSGWQKAGYPVIIGSRDPGAVEAGSLGFAPTAVSTVDEAIERSDVVVLAIPFASVAQLVTANRDKLRGKTVIDISNPFDALANNERAGAEYTADALGTRTGLVAAFKDNFAATINTPGAADGERPDVKIAGDDDAAKQVAAELAEALDHRVVDCGELHNARFIDGMVSLMLILDRAHCDFTMRTGWRFFGLPQR